MKQFLAKSHGLNPIQPNKKARPPYCGGGGILSLKALSPRGERPILLGTALFKAFFRPSRGERPIFKLKALFAGLAVFCLSPLSWAVPFEGSKFVISGPSPHSPAVAKAIFKQGGNIVDMAVGSALALAVTHPYYVSLGSGGFALVKIGSSVQALDFRETAPHKMPADFFEKSGLSSQKGGASVGVPGFVAGLIELHKKHGRLAWRKLIQPALSLAQKGFPVSGEWASITQTSKSKFNPAGRAVFFKKGRAYKPNELFKQAKMAQALKLLQKNKGKAFYGGPIGKDIVSAVKGQKGLMTEEDLKKYTARWLEPVVIPFRGYKIYSMPLPSSGGIILSRALSLIEKQKLFKKALYSADELHLLAEILSRAFRPRILMGDPAFAKIKAADWLSGKALENINKTIFLKKAHRLSPLKESEETTHIALMDAQGNAISMTLTLNGSYGSHIVTKKYGVTLNNQMDDFTTLPGAGNMFSLIQGKNNSIQGGKRPLSSMTPSIAAKRGSTVMALGGAGGPTIISGVLQTLYRHLINKMGLEQAILAGRLHHQFLPRPLFVENKSFSPEIITELKMRGHKIQFRDSIARVFAVSKDKNGRLLSAHEIRGEGASGGL